MLEKTERQTKQIDFFRVDFASYPFRCRISSDAITEDAPELSEYDDKTVRLFFWGDGKKETWSRKFSDAKENALIRIKYISDLAQRDYATLQRSNSFEEYVANRKQQ